MIRVDKRPRQISWNVVGIHWKFIIVCSYRALNRFGSVSHFVRQRREHGLAGRKARKAKESDAKESDEKRRIGQCLPCTTGILLGMNIDPEGRDGLLGFALERLDGASGEKEWLNGIVSFSDTDHEAGDPSHEHSSRSEVPMVRLPGLSRYRVRLLRPPRLRQPCRAWVSEGPTVAVRTADLGGEHGVLFNRAAALEPGFL